MKNRQQWLPYLLLNIFISAVVTGAILFWYDRTYRQALVPVAPSGLSVPVAADVAEATLSPLRDPDAVIEVEIISIVGAGTLDTEIVLVRYTGAGELDLTGWMLKDEDKNIFTFPQLTLYPDGAVQVHTVAGQDTVVDLYWGKENSVWESGEAASLVDAQGVQRATYDVP